MDPRDGTDGRGHDPPASPCPHTDGAAAPLPRPFSASPTPPSQAASLG